MNFWKGLIIYFILVAAISGAFLIVFGQIESKSCQVLQENRKLTFDILDTLTRGVTDPVYLERREHLGNKYPPIQC